MPGASLSQRIDDLAEQVDAIRGDSKALSLTCAQFEGQIQALSQEIADAEERLKQANLDAEELAQTLAILQGLEAAWKKTFEEALATVVSRGLSIIFDKPMRLEILSEISRGASAVEFRLTTGEGDDAITTDIMSAEGGSVVEIASFLLRVLLILASRPPLRRVIVIDESFRMVEDNKVPVLAQMVRELIDRLGIQVILVTHMPAFGDAADVVYSVTRDESKRIPTAAVRRLKRRHEEHR